MNKRILVALTLIPLLGIGGGAALWFVGASKVEQQARTTLDNLRKQSAENTKWLKVEYAEVKVSGFPLRYRIVIEKPKISVDYALLLQQMRPGVSAPRIGWIDEVTPQESIAISRSVFGSEYTLEPLGDVTIFSRVNTQVHHLRYTSETLEPLTLSLDTIPKPTDTPEELLRKFEGVRYHARNLQVLDTDANQPLATLGEYRFALTNEEGAATLALLLKDSVATPAYATFLRNHAYLGPQIEAGSVASPEYSLGTTNVEVDAALSYPAPNAKIQPLAFTLKRLHIDHPFQRTDVSGDLNIGDMKTGVASGFSMKMASETRYDQKFRAAYADRLSAMLTQQLGAAGGSYKATIAEALPRLDTLGAIRVSSDIDLKQPDGILNVRDLTVTTQPFAIGLDGTATGTGPQATGEFRLKLRNYVGFVDLLAGYLNRASMLLTPILQKAVTAKGNSEAATAMANWRISPALSLGIKQFLRVVSDQPQANTTDITITVRQTKGNPMPTIGALSATEVMGRYQQLVVPHLNRKKP